MRTISWLLLSLALISCPALGQKAKAAAHPGARVSAHPGLRPAPLNQEAAAALAQAAAAAATIADADNRSFALVQIGIDQCKAGDLEGLRKLLPGALSALEAFAPTRDSDKSSKAARLAQVGYLHACLGDVAHGIEEVEAQGNEQQRVLGLIAGVQANGGDYEGAVATAKRISVSYHFDDAVEAVIRAQIAAHRFEGALANVDLLRRDYNKMEMLAAVRKEQIRMHLGADSLKVLDQMRALAAGESDPKQKAYLMGEIGKSLGENGDGGGCMSQFDAALKAAEAVPASLNRVGALTQVAAGITKGCDNIFTKEQVTKALAEGAQAAASLSRKDQKTAYYWLAKGYAESGDTATALQMVEKLPVDDYTDENSRTDLRQQIAVAEAKAGGFTTALQQVRALNHIWYRGDGLVGIAEAYGTGNKAQAMALLAEAEGVYHQGDKEPMGDLLIAMALSKVLDDYMMLGESATALRVAGQGGGYEEFGKAMAKNGTLAQLQPALGQTKDARDQADMLLGFADGWLEAHPATPPAAPPAARRHK